MATPIKVIPTLRGEAAKTFIKRAEEHERTPRPRKIYTEAEEKTYQQMLKNSGMQS